MNNSLGGRDTKKRKRSLPVFSTDLLNNESTDNNCTALFFQIGLDTSYWTVVNQFFIWGSLSVYFAITFTMYSDGMYMIFTASFPFVGKPWDKFGLRSKWAHCRPQICRVFLVHAIASLEAITEYIDCLFYKKCQDISEGYWECLL